MHKIIYTELAEQDLFSLFELITEDKPSVAVAYIDKLEEHIELLQDNPHLGLECKAKKVYLNCRVLIYEDYLIFYKISHNDIHILRILNSKINYQETF